MDLDDRELLAELVVESQDHLSALEPDLLALEKGVSPEETLELVNRIFRGIHSIKGGCGFLGITAVQNLTHAMESVLMKVRSRRLDISRAMVDVLLDGTDRVREMLADVSRSAEIDATDIMIRMEPFLAAEPPADGCCGAPIPDAIRSPDVMPLPALIPAPVPLNAAGRSGYIPLTAKAAPGNVAGTAGTAAGVAERPAASTASLHPAASETPAPRAAGNDADTGQPAAAVIAGGTAGSQRATAPDVLRVKVDLLNRLLNLAGELVLVRNQLLQTLDRKFNETAAGEAIFTALQGAVDEAQQRLRDVTESRHRAGDADEDARERAEQIVRILNRLGNRIESALPKRLSELAGMNATMVNLDAVTTNLQENIMRTRMQSIEALFGKLPRQVRQLAKQTGKEIELIVTGNEVELDKSIVEALSDPLNHLIRNSLDHGFEDPSAREAVGKSRTGRLDVRAFHEAGQVNIEIEDDGRGIDPRRLRAKAVEKGIITAEQATRLDDREAVLLVFAPGFSTAEQVSDISGRGVGMDVVRTNIESLGGSIEIDSQLGVGTRTRLKLPLTLAIIPSLLVRACGRRFAIPQVSLDELVRLRSGRDDQRIEQVQGAEVMRMRGDLLPLVRLSALLAIETDAGARAGTATYVAVLKTGEHRYGLVVDEVMDSEEVVVKQLPASLKESHCYAGATIMGDGSVAMILDILGIADAAGLRFTDQAKAVSADEYSDSYLDRTESQTLLLFRNAPDGERFALNLALISRIEKVAMTDVQRVGNREFLKFGDGALRLLRLPDFLPVKAPLEEPREVFVIIPKMVKHPLGIIAWECDDVVSARVEVDRDNVRATGILGSGMINGDLTVFLDIFGLFEAAEPEIYRADEARTATIERARILLAEDTSFFRAVVKNYIEALGATVTTAKDGREAWHLLNETPEGFDLVVTDIEMPLMDGLELTRHIRASTRHAGLPVVALTSLGSEGHREAGLAAGVTAYETKLDKDRLAATIREVLEEVHVHA
jgi:two-component system chemotaxis sensor kinase CheA